MRKIILLISQTLLALTSVFTLVSCKMASHSIEFNIINSNKEATIFDKAFSLKSIDETINNFANTSTRNQKIQTISWLKTNKEVLKGLNKDLTESFYADLDTRSQDTYFYQFDILNQFSANKLKLNDVDLKVVTEIKSFVVTTSDPKVKVDFNLFFQGVTTKYLFKGSVSWYYKISEIKINEKSNLKFEWKYNKANSEITIKGFSKV